MTALVAAAKPQQLSFPCWHEHHGVAVNTPARKASWHADCPGLCSCPAHGNDRADLGEEVAR